MAESNDLDENNVRVNLLIGCTGSVASVKIPVIIQKLLDTSLKVNIKLVCTEHALHFFDHTKLPPEVPVHRDQEEWQTWQKMSDPVLHVELRRWAEVLLIAPLDANTMAKLAHGICDNLLTCVVRAWDMDRPLLFAPAMNTFMWEHPLTYEHRTKLKTLGYVELPVVKKTLACGDTGFGAMAEAETIVSKLSEIVVEICRRKTEVQSGCSTSKAT